MGRTRRQRTGGGVGWGGEASPGCRVSAGQLQALSKSRDLQRPQRGARAPTAAEGCGPNGPGPAGPGVSASGPRSLGRRAAHHPGGAAMPRRLGQRPWGERPALCPEPPGARRRCGRFCVQEPLPSCHVELVRAWGLWGLEPPVLRAQPPRPLLGGCGGLPSGTASAGRAEGSRAPAGGRT